MKTRNLLLPVLTMVMAPVLFGGCYTTISQSVYARPEAQMPDRSGNIGRPVADVNSSQEDSLAADTDQQGTGAQNDFAGNGDGQYGYPPEGFNGPYGMPGPYGYDDGRYPPGWYGSYDPYIYTPHLHFGLLFDSGDPFYWHDPWFFGYNSWNDPFGFDPWYSPYYSMYDPWYDNYYGSSYHRGYSGYDYYHRYNGRGGRDGLHDNIASGQRVLRQDRLAGFGSYANTRSSYASDNSVTGRTTGSTGSAAQVNRRTAGTGSGTINTRNDASTVVSGKATTGAVASPDNRTPVQGNPIIRQRTRQGGMTRRVNNPQPYVITVPDDGTGRAVVQYRDQPSQPTDPNDIRIGREVDTQQTPQASNSENRQGQNVTQQRRSGDTETTQSNNAPAPEQNTERAAARPGPAQNNTPTERADTSRSNPPSGDTERSTPSYTPSNRGNSTPSYTPRSSGGSSSGGQSRNSSSRSGSRRR